MKLFGVFARGVIGVAFPFLVAINLFTFLLTMTTDYNFLGVEVQTFTARYAHILEFCPEGHRLTTFFGVKSLFDMFEAMDFSRTPKIIQGLAYSFFSANWAIPKTTIAALGDKESVLSIAYVICGYIFQPLYVVAWLGYAIIQFGIEIYNVMHIILLAFAGYYNRFRCSTYPIAPSDIPIVTTTFNYFRMLI